MGFIDTLPHWFLVIVVILVVVFVIKKLIKFALIVGLVGVVIWLVWWRDVFNLMGSKLIEAAAF